MTTDISFNSKYNDRVISVRDSYDDAQIAIEAPFQKRTEFAFLNREAAQQLVNALASVFEGLEPIKPPTPQEVFEALPFGTKFTVTDTSGRVSEGDRVKLDGDRYYSTFVGGGVHTGVWTASQTITEVK